MINILSTSDKLIERQLSNFYPYEFEIDNIKIISIESFLQSLKTNDENIKNKILKLSGYSVYKFGQNIKWNDKLYWNNNEYDRYSDSYRDLISHAYNCLYLNEEFKYNLNSTKDEILDHSIGSSSKKYSILTKSEFLFQLNRLRNNSNKKHFYDLFSNI